MAFVGVSSNIISFKTDVYKKKFIQTFHSGFFFRSAAEALLCKYAFPDCILKDGVPSGLPLCQEDCVAVKTHFCMRRWAILEDDKRRGAYLKSRGHFRLPNCSTLPEHSNCTTSKQCTRSSITEMKWDMSTSRFILCCTGGAICWHLLLICRNLH